MQHDSCGHLLPGQQSSPWEHRRMNFKAQSTFTPVDISRAMQTIVPKLVIATQQGAEAVASEAQAIVPVDTGELRDSIGVGPVELVGQSVRGYVEATSAHAAFVEFGTGQRGAASAGAGDGPYSPSWPGMPAQPYMRPALDIGRPAILAAYERQGFKVG
jgi:HK97 gp10 family phage protein